MLIRVVTGTGLLLLAVAISTCLLLLWPKGLKTAVNHLLSEDGITLTCLDYRVSWPDTLHIRSLCMTHQSVSVEASAANYRLSDHALTIRDLTIKTLEKETSDPSAAGRFSMPSVPQSLPSVNIARVQLEDNHLAQPLVFSVEQTDVSSWTLSNRWQIDVEAHENRIEGQVTLTFSDLLPLLKSDLTQHVNTEPDLPATVGFALQDDKIELLIRLPERLTLTLPTDGNTCDVPLSITGSLATTLQLSQLSARILPNDFAISLPVQSCLLPPLPEMLTLPEKLSASIASEMSFEQGQLHIPELHVFSPDKHWQLVGQKVLVEAQGELRAELQLLASPYSGVSVDGKGQITMTDQVLALQSENISVKAPTLVVYDTQIENLSGQAKIHYDASKGASLNGNLTLSKLSTQNAQLSGLTIQFQGTGQEYNSLKGTLDAQLDRLSQGEALTLQHIEQTIRFQPEPPVGKVLITGETHAAQLSVASYELGAIKADHRLLVSHSDGTFEGEHDLVMFENVNAHLNSSKNQLDLLVPRQPFTHLIPLFDAHLPDLTPVEGELALVASYTPDNNLLTGNASVYDIAAEYDEYRFSGAETQWDFSLDSAGLQVPDFTLLIKTIDVGLPISNTRADLRVENSVPAIVGVNTRLLGGTVTMGPLRVSEQKQTVFLAVEDIDLASVLALQQDAGVESGGISISGKIAGNIPVTLENWQASVEQATLTNQSLGTLKIQNNTAFESLKASQPEIGQQLAMLENLDFTHLEGKLNLNADGQAFLDIKIEGVNPDFQQPVAFNYTHDQNVFTLLRSLRLADQISDKVKDKYLGKGPP